VGVIYLDACLVIYLTEEHARWGGPVADVIQRGRAKRALPSATPSDRPPHRRRPGPASQELTTATASISIIKSGPARRVTPTVVLVGVATPR
jgi:hypothetical protein